MFSTIRTTYRIYSSNGGTHATAAPRTLLMVHPDDGPNRSFGPRPRRHVTLQFRLGESVAGPGIGRANNAENIFTNRPPPSLPAGRVLRGVGCQQDRFFILFSVDECAGGSSNLRFLFRDARAASSAVGTGLGPGFIPPVSDYTCVSRKRTGHSRSYCHVTQPPAGRSIVWVHHKESPQKHI